MMPARYLFRNVARAQIGPDKSNTSDRDVAHSFGALMDAVATAVHKPVKLNLPFYGVDGQGWFLGIHCITKYVKVAFFRGTSLRPLPPASPSKRKCATSASTRTSSGNSSRLSDR
jgi:hypothetical protein